MSNIIRGTTPTFLFTFKEIDVADIVSAYLSIKAKTMIEKDLSEATVGEKSLSWTLNQTETLSFGDEVSVMLNWKLQDGTRGASVKTHIIIQDNYKEVEI